MRFILALLLMSGTAMAQVQNRTYQDSLGRNTGRSVTDSRGNTTYYDSMGRNTGRSVTRGNTTTLDDSSGRQTGRIGRVTVKVDPSLSRLWTARSHWLQWVGPP